MVNFRLVTRLPWVGPIRKHSYIFAMYIIAILIVVTILYVASLQWFYAEDFPSLGHARGVYQHFPKPWLEFFFPLSTDWSWAHRPISVEIFFHLGNKIFGLNAFGYLVICIAFHFASAILLYILSLQLGLHRNAAIFLALLSATRYPSMAELFHISNSSYFFAKFFISLAVLLTLLDLKATRVSKKLSLRALSLLASSAAMLSNESGVITPAVVAALLTFHFGVSKVFQNWSRVLAMLLPHAIVAIIYLYVRFEVVVLAPQGSVYNPSLGLHNLYNAITLSGLTFGSTTILVIVSIFLLLPATWLASRQKMPAKSKRELAKYSLFATAWLAIALLPFVIVPGASSRFAILAETPLSLLLGIWASFIWDNAQAHHRRAVGAVVIILSLILVPWQVIYKQATAPRSNLAEAFVDWYDKNSTHQTKTVVVSYGGNGMADSQAAKTLRFAIWNGAALRALNPHHKFGRNFFRVVDLRSESLPANCRRCIYAAFMEDFSFKNTNRKSIKSSIDFVYD